MSDLVESWKEKVDSVWKHASRADVGVSSVNEEMETLMRDLGEETLRLLYPQQNS